MSENPPKIKVEEGSNKTITIMDFWYAAKRWSPAGIGGILLIIFLALGGSKGIIELVEGLTRAMNRTNEVTKEMALLRQEIKALREERLAEREQTKVILTRVTANEKHISMNCDLASELNQGKPNYTWCSADGRGIRWEPKPPNGVRIPINITHAEW